MGDKNQKKVDEKNNATVVPLECLDDDVVTLVCAIGQCNHIIDSNNEWAVNLAASYYYIPKQEYFSSYRAEILAVKMG